MTAFLSRQEHFDRTASTNDEVRRWLAEGTPEVCLAVADEQTAGRGRVGRTWTAPPGAALLLSAGFRPSWLEPGRAWRLAAIVALAMADAAEDVAGLRDRAIRLKWPNDLVVEAPGLDGDLVAAGLATTAGPGSATAGPGSATAGPGSAVGGPLGPTLRKIGGVLGEVDGAGTAEERVVVGIGLNVGWERPDFPAAIAAAMTSLHEVSGGRPIDRAILLDGFLSRLEARVEALRAGRFPIDDWTARQVTTGRLVRLEGHGGASEEVRAVGLDPRTGALLVEDAAVPGGEREIHAGEVVHVRLAASPAPGMLPAPNPPTASAAAGV